MVDGPNVTDLKQFTVEEKKTQKKCVGVEEKMLYSWNQTLFQTLHPKTVSFSQWDNI